AAGRAPSGAGQPRSSGRGPRGPSLARSAVASGRSAVVRVLSPHEPGRRTGSPRIPEFGNYARSHQQVPIFPGFEAEAPTRRGPVPPLGPPASSSPHRSRARTEYKMRSIKGFVKFPEMEETAGRPGLWLGRCRGHGLGQGRCGSGAAKDGAGHVTRAEAVVDV